MKTTKFITVILAIFGFAFLSTLESCKKEDAAEVPVSKTSLLTKSGWVKTALEITTPSGTADFFDFIDDCEKDNILILKSDKTITEDEGALKCDPADSQTSNNGTWALTSNDTKLTFTDNGDVSVVGINTLTSTQLIISYTEYDSTIQADVIYKLSYKH